MWVFAVSVRCECSLRVFAVGVRCECSLWLFAVSVRCLYACTGVLTTSVFLSIYAHSLNWLEFCGRGNETIALATLWMESWSRNGKHRQTHVYICTHTYICIYTYTCVHMHTHIYVYTHTHVYICTHMCVYVNLHIPCLFSGMNIFLSIVYSYLCFYIWLALVHH